MQRDESYGKDYNHTVLSTPSLESQGVACGGGASSSTSGPDGTLVPPFIPWNGGQQQRPLNQGVLPQTTQALPTQLSGQTKREIWPFIQAYRSHGHEYAFKALAIAFEGLLDNMYGEFSDGIGTNTVPYGGLAAHEHVPGPGQPPSQTTKIHAIVDDYRQKARLRCVPLTHRQRKHQRSGEVLHCTHGCGQKFDRPDDWIKHELLVQPQEFWVCVWFVRTISKMIGVAGT